MARKLWSTLIALLAGCATQPGSAPLERVQTIVVIYAENHSFDNMYGLFPGANGVANATAEQKTQLDHDGKPLPALPATYNGGKLDPRFATQGLPNGPFRIDAASIGARFDQVVPSPIHNYWQNIEQINGGKNNKFVAVTNVGAWAMGYYDGSSRTTSSWAPSAAPTSTTSGWCAPARPYSRTRRRRCGRSSTSTAT